MRLSSGPAQGGPTGTAPRLRPTEGRFTPLSLGGKTRLSPSDSRTAPRATLARVSAGHAESWSGWTLERFSPALAAFIDVMRPSLKRSWGGPFNGQRVRQLIVQDLARAISFDRVYETGTFRGTTTEFLAATFGCPVFTVEISERFYFYNRLRFARNRLIHTERGDSRSFLNRHAGLEETAFIYLDAHWRGDLPVREELRTISAGWRRALVMIDDFRVPGDGGYGFEDYGPGKVLAEEILPVEDMPGWALFYPASASSEETGSQRGCCVLASAELATGAAVRHLRRARLRF